MLHILLAEDNQADIFLVRHALREHNIDHWLYMVKDGEQAIDFVAQMGKPGCAPCPDVILLDLNLPKVDGPQILNELHQHPKCADTPVIVVTSSDAPQDQAHAHQLGVSRYFRKPLDLDSFLQLGAVVREVVETK